MVCRQIRAEFRPLYLAKQEFGIDLTESVLYIQTFYPQFAVPSFSAEENARIGNLTIAISNDITAAEKGEKGVDIWPLLDFWANSDRIEAGFGRYSVSRPGYDAIRDGEAKDLYRLFGRRVLPNRRCGRMNQNWRNVLVSKKLAEIRIHRGPRAATPFIHILYQPEHRENWMEMEVSLKPYYWAGHMGFASLEYFELKVGVLFEGA